MGAFEAMLPLISVITAIGPDPQPFVEEASESVRLLVDQAKTIGRSVEWLVALDAGATHLSLGATETIILRGPSGIAATRNAALSKVRGEWVVPLDADDKLNGDGVLSAIEIACRNGWSWVGANRRLIDGARTPHWFTEESRYQAGELATNWRSPFVFHPNSVLVRSDLILRVGGWPAVRVNEDLGMVLLVSEIADGGRTPQVITQYRKWPGQQVAREGYARDKVTSFNVIERIVNARRAHLGRSLISRPVYPGAAIGTERKFE